MNDLKDDDPFLYYLTNNDSTIDTGKVGVEMISNNENKVTPKRESRDRMSIGKTFKQEIKMKVSLKQLWMLIMLNWDIWMIQL